MSYGGDWAMHRTGIWLSRRSTFRAGDMGWDAYIAFIDLPHLREVRSIDSALNHDLDGTVFVHDLDALDTLLAHVEPLEAESQYYQLLVHHALETPALHDPS